MNCPVCGQDCIQSSDDLITNSAHRFDACPFCHGLRRDKRLPPILDSTPPPCPVCGKRYIDDVFSHIWLILAEEKIISPASPLAGAGVPHLHPFMVLGAPPYLPHCSMILPTHAIDKPVADRLMAEVPELQGVVRDRQMVPGLSCGIDSPVFHTHELVAGFDLHASIFSSNAGNVVVYQRSSTMHVEMPRPFNPKFAATSRMIGRTNPTTVIDGCSGVGTIGIAASLAGMPHVILNDRWYAAAFWSAVNIAVNCRPLGIDDFSWQIEPTVSPEKKIRRCPVKIATASGSQAKLEVWHGDFRCLPRKIHVSADSLSVFDPFEKEDLSGMEKIMSDWKKSTGSRIFMP